MLPWPINRKRNAVAMLLLATIVLIGHLASAGESEMSEQDEKSGSGAPILRHEAKDRDWTAPEHSGRNLESVEAHLEKYIGPVDFVYHEIVSDLIHLDLLYIKPTKDRPYAVVATSGVSDLPMSVPEGMEEYARAELLIALPEGWPTSDEAHKDEANYWPLRWLKSVGRLPHDYETWIGYGHTIPNGDPPEPIADTEFVGVMVSMPYWLDADFFQLEADSGDTVTFWDVVPLYGEEMQFKLDKGAEALEKRFEKQDIGFVLDIHRPNVAKSKGWFGR